MFDRMLSRAAALCGSSFSRSGQCQIGRKRHIRVILAVIAVAAALMTISASPGMAFAEPKLASTGDSVVNLNLDNLRLQPLPTGDSKPEETPANPEGLIARGDAVATSWLEKMGEKAGKMFGMPDLTLHLYTGLSGTGFRIAGVPWLSVEALVEVAACAKEAPVISGVNPSVVFSTAIPGVSPYANVFVKEWKARDPQQDERVEAFEKRHRASTADSHAPPAVDQQVDGEGVFDPADGSLSIESEPASMLGRFWAGTRKLYKRLTAGRVHGGANVWYATATTRHALHRVALGGIKIPHFLMVRAGYSPELKDEQGAVLRKGRGCINFAFVPLFFLPVSPIIAGSISGEKVLQKVQWVGALPGKMQAFNEAVKARTVAVGSACWGGLRRAGSACISKLSRVADRTMGGFQRGESGLGAMRNHPLGVEHSF